MEGEEPPMKCFKAFFLVTVLVLSAGCYASSTRNGHDAGPDGADVPPDAAPDAVPDLPLPDILPDTPPDIPPFDAVDAPDIVPAAPYTLHEWGVISTGLGSSEVHGPSPVTIMDMADKPVIYLYSDGEVGPVSIGVNFVPSFSTDVWPVLPAGVPIEWANLSLHPGSCTTTPFPYPWDREPCEVCNLSSCVVADADCVTFTGADGAATTSRLLFYSGPMGDFTPPLYGETVFSSDMELPSVAVSLTNTTSRPVRDIWFIYRLAVGTCPEPWWACPATSASIALRHIDSIDPGAHYFEVLPVGFYQAPVDPEGWPAGDLPLPEEWLNLGKDLLEKLVARGLTDAEAGAFMANWEQVFFGLFGDYSYQAEPLYTNGAFVVYFMGREDYDAQFPLAATPPPRESVRVGMVYQVLPMFNE
jgi:hypothetical protein